MRRKKISVIGAGFVGGAAAHWLLQKELGNIVIIDINKGLAKGRALDLYQSSAIEGVDVRVQGSDDYSDTKDSDLIIITAGFPRKEGMSRDDLLKKNASIISQVCESIKKTSPSAIVIVVSNPLDAMVYQAWRVLQFPKNKVMGMAGILDTARFCAFIAQDLGISVQDIKTLVLGGHGDTMTPVLSKSWAGARPLSDCLSKEKLEALVERTKKGGGEIVSLLKTGSAYYAPSRGAVQMAEAILKDQKRILPCTVFLNGEYGFRDLAIGVPVKLGKEGVEEIIEIPLSDSEKKDFEKSASAIQKNQERLRGLFK